MAQVTVKDMLNCGVHFGHQTHRWNPKMKNFVFGTRGGIHIIDLQKSVVLAQKAADHIKEVAANGGQVIFVGTKKQASTPIREAAEKCKQFYVTKRWLGGTLTNYVTIKASIDRLRKLDIMKEKGDFAFYNKKEQSQLDKEYNKLNEYLEGIREMKGLPKAIFVVDLRKEHIAVQEAKKLGISVIGIADTNSDPDAVDFPIPGNDDAIRSIKLFANLVADSYLEGAKLYEEKVRNQSDKEVEPEDVEEKSETTPQEGGPAIVKMAKQGTRKLVAVGTADEVEIELELSAEKTEDDDSTNKEDDENKETETESK